eukprot:scaffold61920_cov58-Phaeocystis_antarctica.AAC.1
MRNVCLTAHMFTCDPTADTHVAVASQSLHSTGTNSGVRQRTGPQVDRMPPATKPTTARPAKM